MIWIIRYINWSATSVLGIYLLHGNPYVSSLVVYPLYTGIFNHVGNQVLLFVIHILFAFVVILICVLVDKSRQILFSFFE